MGASTDASIIVGIRIPYDVQQDYFIDHPVEVAGCSHSVDKSDNFCSVCGKPRTIKKELTATDLQEMFEKKGYAVCRDESVLVCGRRLAQVFDLEAGSGTTKVLENDLTRIKNGVFESMGQWLEPKGLWDQKEFGVWLVGITTC